ncbi:MAG: peptidyl-prolyl cis-trans isomerase [Alphaproteobacteria bacterium]|nr:peptidyl-prolyl cis-trans isomerase [Alphaproteobacteria bacterium]
MILRSMRSGLLSAIFLGILVLGGFSLVLTDWNGFFHGPGVSKTDVAKVDGHPIKASEFNAQVSRVLHNQNINPSMAYQAGVIDNILQGEIVSRLMHRAALDFGVEIEDKFVAEQISSLIEPMITKDVDNKRALQQFVQMQGMSEKQLVSLVRGNIEENVIRGVLNSANYVPRDQISDLLSYERLTRAGEYVVLKSQDVKLGREADDATLREYYKTVEANYLTPETRDATIAILTVDPKELSVKIPAEDIKNYYDEYAEDFKIPETRRLEQAILPTKDQAEKILAKAKSSQDLQNAVKDVTGKESAFSQAADFKQDELSEDLAHPIFAAKAGDLVGPLQSPLGFHVFKIVKIEPAHVEPLAEATKNIESKLASEQQGNEIYKLTAAIEDRLAGGEDYVSIQKDYPALKIEKISGLKAADQVNLKESKLSPELSPEQGALISKKIFQQSQGEAGAMGDLSANSFYTVTVDHINAAQPKEFAQVRADLLKNWTREQQSQENLKRTEDWVAKLNQGQMTLDQLAKANNLKVENFNDLSRKKSADQAADQGANESDGNESSAASTKAGNSTGKATPSPSPFLREPAMADRYLNVAQGKFIAASSQDGQKIILGRVTKTTLGDGLRAKEDRVENLGELTATMNAALLINSLERTYKVDINRALLDRIYAPRDSEAE